MRARGLSLVELLVAMALGLLIVAAAGNVLGDHVAAQRRLLLEARLDHDLRAALDLIARDLERAGYWAHALAGVARSDAAAAVNPYAGVTQADTTQIEYAYARDTDDTLDSAEQVGVRVSRGALQYRPGEAGWQALLDSDSVRATAFTVQLLEEPLELAAQCPCIAARRCDEATVQADASRPQLVRRRVALRLRVASVADPALQREATQTLRLRNDERRGRCPE